MNGLPMFVSSSVSIAMAMRALAVMIAGIILLAPATPGKAQSAQSGPAGQATATVPGWGNAVEDNTVFAHVLFDQLEGRSNGPDNSFRWDAEGWIGTDMNRLWVKSEGSLENDKVSDGDNELLYDRPIPRWRYFDVQAGVREDLDSGPRRTWGAIGIEGLAPYYFEFAPTFYFRNDRIAARLTGSYDLLITQRLILQPEAEINFYSKRDPRRGVGSGFSDLDTGLRLRYEISRKFSPYVGFAYSGKFGESTTFARREGEPVRDLRLVFGIRIWH